MTYQAIVAQINSITPVSGLDNLVLANILGTNCLVGKNEYTVGALGILFCDDGQLSHEFCHNNNLYNKPELNKDKTKKGYFSENRRVRAQKFKGVKSEGFFCDLSYLAFTNIRETYKVGDKFDNVGGIPICNKYLTPATIRSMKIGELGKPKGPKRLIESFLKHKDTEHFSRNAQFIPDGSIIYITEKLHGTSFRFGYTWVEEDFYRVSPFYKKWLSKLGLLNLVKSGYQHLNGTRNTVLGKTDKQFYDSKLFRDIAVSGLYNRLYEGETIYGELVGYTTTGKPIMSKHNTEKLKDKEIERKYGKEICYSYGCEVKDCKAFVYRITRTDSKGNYVEYSWPQVKARCQELRLNWVPELSYCIFGPNMEDINIEPLKRIIADLVEGSSLLGPTHIREGVVLRIEPPVGKPYWLKEKSLAFRILEGIVKEDDNYIDVEEIS